MHVRGARRPTFAPRLREIAVAVDPTLRLGTVHALDEFERQDQLAVRLVALVVGLVLLSVVPALGGRRVRAHVVHRHAPPPRDRHPAALGAHPRQVLRNVLGRVASQVAIGLVVGVIAAAVVDRATSGALLHGRAAVLLPAFGVLMAVVALLAALGPARDGLGIAPTEALRAET